MNNTLQKTGLDRKTHFELGLNTALGLSTVTPLALLIWDDCTASIKAYTIDLETYEKYEFLNQKYCNHADNSDKIDSALVELYTEINAGAFAEVEDFSQLPQGIVSMLVCGWLN